MNNSIRMTVLLVILCATTFPGTGFCVSSDELALLDMYYGSKDLVSSTTRSIKPISHTAENITVVTAQNIRAMNAHTVDEVLNQVPGLFIDFNRDFGGASYIRTQGAEGYHTLVLVDGMPWNSLLDNNVRIHGIPVEIIERIEIIKGPASSTWGSSLGGVVNIITKYLDPNESPSGTLYGTYGERNTYDVRGGYTGHISKALYYLYAGRQESDGLRFGRDFENDNFFSKIKIPLKGKGGLQISIGYTKPDLNNISVAASYWDPWVSDWDEYLTEKTLFGNSTLDAWLSSEIKMNFAFHFFKREPEIKDLWPSSLKAPYSEFNDEERLIGGSASLTWFGENHTLVLGAETNYSDVDTGTSWGGIPAESESAHENDWAVFINDTLSYGKWSATPGIRYDYNSIYGSFVSPSLGVTYQTNRDILLRGSIAKGFTAPNLVITTIGGWVTPNPDLDPEEVWSYQAGIESKVSRQLFLKCNFFYHEISERFEGNEDYTIVNSGSSRRKGLELEMETTPLKNISLAATGTWVRSSSDETKDFDMYVYHIKAQYEKTNDFQAVLLGQYIQGYWKNDEPIWDFNFSKHLLSRPRSNVWLIFTAHNLFNGQQHDDTYYRQNPKRWVEAGLRVDFN